MIKLALLSLILYANLVQTTTLEKPATCSSSHMVTVHVISHLPPNSEKLFVHCASSDDDLGNISLYPNKEFHFSFCVIPFSTLFSCDLQWGLYYKSFEVFNSEQPGGPCSQGKCIWSAENSGIALAGNLVHHWDKY